MHTALKKIKKEGQKHFWHAGASLFLSGPGYAPYQNVPVVSYRWWRPLSVEVSPWQRLGWGFTPSNLEVFAGLPLTENCCTLFLFSQEVAQTPKTETFAWEVCCSDPLIRICNCNFLRKQQNLTVLFPQWGFFFSLAGKCMCLRTRTLNFELFNFSVCPAIAILSMTLIMNLKIIWWQRLLAGSDQCVSSAIEPHVLSGFAVRLSRVEQPNQPEA